MAKIIQKNIEPPKSPKPKKTINKTFAILFFLGAVFCGVAYLSINTFHLLMLAFLLLLCCFISWLTCFDFNYDYKSAKERYGEAGERMTGSILGRYLPDGYTVVQNSIITYDGHKSEIDNIIVGKTGVFIVEVKNVKGDIIGNYEDKHWFQNKTDKYGIEHPAKELYNPVKQVGTHIYRLANHLRDNKIFTHISGAVYFANPQANIFIKGDLNDIPIFTYNSTHKMIDYIKNGTANLSDNTIEKILDLLK